MATNQWVASIVDWTPAGKMIRTDGAQFRNYVAAWEASRAMARARREVQGEEAG